MDRPWPYLVVIPATFAVGYLTATGLAILSSALGVDANLARYGVLPITLLAMTVFFYWSRTDANGKTRIFP